MNLATRVTTAIAIAVCAFAAGTAPAHAKSPVRVSLVKDIYPGKLDSSASRFVRLGDVAYFEAYSPAAGGELWRTDGTKRGTRMVTDIVPGKSSSSPRGLAATDRYVFFTVLGENNERLLWRSDGTAAGTGPVPGTDGLPIRTNMLATGDFDLFEAWNEPGSSHLWATDGDAPATDLGDLAAVAYDSATLGPDAYLPVFDQPGGAGLVRTDGTPAGTFVVRGGLASAGSLGDPVALNAVAGVVYFFVPTVHGPELWRSDGTDAGTSRVASIPDEVNGAAPAAGRLVFVVNNTELWTSDGTAAGTRALGIPGGRTLLGLTAVGGRAYFDLRGRLWRSDGTEAGTRQVSPGRLSQPFGFARVGGRTLFAAKGATHGQELWQTKGTARSTRRVSDIFPGKRDAGISGLTSLGDRAVFVAREARHGRELYVAVPRR
jgi:ELWxxDGT repeat protein